MRDGRSAATLYGPLHCSICFSLTGRVLTLVEVSSTMLRSALLSTATGLAFAALGVAQNVPTNFVVDTLISSGLQAGHDFSFLPDGRVLIANRGGLVQVWAGSGSPVSIGTVSGVQTGSERGLLSIEADPNFATNGYFHVWWPSTSDSFRRLDRRTCTGPVARPASHSSSTCSPIL
mgnify:CR=1 FL=1